MKFLKSYVIVVNIDTEEGHNDAEWCTENWETSDLTDFIAKVHDDVEKFIKENKLND